MCLSLVLAFFAMILFGLVDVSYKVINLTGMKGYDILFFQSLFFAPVVVTLSLLSGAPPAGKVVILSLCSGIACYCSIFLFSYSLSFLDVSLASPIFRMNFLFTVLLALFFLDEILTIKKVFLIVMATASAALFVYDSIGSRKTLTGVFLVIFSSFLMGSVNLLYKISLNADGSPIAILAIQASAFLVLASVVFWNKIKMRSYPLKVGFFWGGIVGLTLVVAFFSLITALKLGQIISVAPVSQMSFIISSVIGVLFLKEAISIKKLTGILCAILLSFFVTV